MAKSGVPPEAVEITRINEHQRTIRLTVISVAVVVCVWLITDAIVKIVYKPEPAWLTLCLAILAPLAIGGAPIIRLLTWTRKYIKKHTQRTIELEKLVDTSRSSSDLREDGTLPDD